MHLEGRASGSTKMRVCGNINYFQVIIRFFFHYLVHIFIQTMVCAHLENKDKTVVFKISANLFAMSVGMKNSTSEKKMLEITS